LRIGDTIVAALLFSLGLLAGWEARRAWTDPAWKPRVESSLLLAPLGRRAAVGAPRALACRAIVGISAAVIVAVEATRPDRRFNSFQTLVATAGVLGALVGTCLMVTTIWLGWPRWLVPPRLRDIHVAPHGDDRRNARGVDDGL
jgi:hypothetical protein